MIRYSVLFFALIVTAPFINFSLTTGANIPLTYILAIAFIPLALFASRNVPVRTLGLEDVAFLSFLVISFASYLLNHERFPEGHGLKQIVNVSLTYLLYKVSLLLLFRSSFNSQPLLRAIFNYNSWLQFLALIIFFVGYFFGPIQEAVIELANNSQNFTIGAVATSFPHARIFGFAPEPSFWALFAVMNLTLIFSIEKPSRFSLSSTLSASCLPSAGLGCSRSSL